MQARLAAALGALVSTVALATPGDVIAAEPPTSRAQLMYARGSGADRCPDEQTVRQSVAARLGYDPFSPEAPRIVTASVRATPKGMTARITMSNVAGEISGRREITTSRRDCSDLGPALALAVALAIDPLSASRVDSTPSAPVDPRQGDIIIREISGAPEESPAGSEPPGAPAPVPPPEMSPSRPRSGSPPSLIQPSQREPTRIRLGAAVLMGLSLFPPVSAGLSLQVGFRERTWSISLEGRGDLPGSVNTEGGRVSTALLLAAMVPCLHVPLASGRVELGGCLIIAAGARYASREGATANGTDFSPNVELGARVAAELPLGKRFALRAHVDVLVAAYDEDIQLRDVGVTVAASPLSAAVGLGALVYLR